MGSTNTGCALTGLEIVEGEPAYAVMLHCKAIEFEGHWVTTPPLLGIYDGFGSINLTQDVPCLGLKQDDVWPNAASKHIHETDRAIFLHPDVFDALGDIAMDDEETFGEAAGRKSIAQRQSIEDQIKTFRDKAGTFDPEILNSVIAVISLEDHFRQTWVGACNVLSTCLEDRDLLDSFIDINARANVLEMASMTLRRPLVPTSWGAQETQDMARIAVFDLAAGIARTRSNETDEE